MVEGTITNKSRWLPEHNKILETLKQKVQIMLHTCMVQNFPSVSVEIIILPPLCFSVLFDTYEEFPKKPCRCQVDLEIGSKTEAK